jgi:hypothetical protein
MTLENVKELSDSELSQVIAWAQGEQKARAEGRKHNHNQNQGTGRGGRVYVSIGGQTGRPAKEQLEQRLRKLP